MAKIKSRFCVVWTDAAEKKVMVQDVRGQRYWTRPEGGLSWSDPIGASYTAWRQMSVSNRCLSMLETAIDLAVQGYDLTEILREFAKVDCFYQLGTESAPMCRALTQVLLGRCLEPNTMSFDELMENGQRLEDAQQDSASAGDVLRGL